MPVILVVDDHLALVDILRDLLTGYTVVMAADGAAALYQLQAEKPDLILLDLKLPDVDGMIVLGQLRRLTGVPIIVLSARDEQVARVVCLWGGADDYISKPFDIDDLEARVEAVMRRARPAVPVPPIVPPIAHIGSLSISNAYGATWKGKPIGVTPVEHKLLNTLMQRPGEVVSREDLVLPIWGPDLLGVDVHSMNVHMSRLRHRLATFPSAPTITTLKGRGYMIHEKVETS